LAAVAGCVKSPRRANRKLGVELNVEPDESPDRRQDRRAMSWVFERFSRSVVSMSALCLFLGVVAFAGAASAQEAAADPGEGAALFTLCTQCHGADGGGNADALAPAIAGLPAWYIEAQLVKFKSGQRGLHAQDTGGLRMYPMSRWLENEAEQKAVSAYVASLPAVQPAATLAPSGDAAKGQGYYAVCSACHGADGAGNQGMGAPPLTGLNDWYLLSSIQKYKNSIRGSLPGDTLGPAMIGMVATLPDDAAVLDVIAHIQTLKAPAPQE
jgi:cytochrome c553